jgi:hypothetical protein
MPFKSDRATFINKLEQLLRLMIADDADSTYHGALDGATDGASDGSKSNRRSDGWCERWIS